MQKNSGLYVKHVKRVLDVMCASLAIVLFFWLYLIVAVLVRIKLGSPIIFKQQRPGRIDPQTGEEKIFWLYKFRTMTDEKDKNGKLLPDELRLTKFGRALRESSMDELPEAINILKGDMSIVGPRPLLVRDMVFMSNEQRRRHTVRPGLSGLAQTRGRNALEWDNKLRYDLEYVERITFWRDCKIIYDTFMQVFFRRKGQADESLDEIAITDDFGDFLLKKDRITKNYYEEKLEEARKLLL